MVSHKITFGASDYIELRLDRALSAACRGAVIFEGDPEVRFVSFFVADVCFFLPQDFPRKGCLRRWFQSFLLKDWRSPFFFILFSPLKQMLPAPFDWFFEIQSSSCCWPCHGMPALPPLTCLWKQVLCRNCFCSLVDFLSPATLSSLIQSWWHLLKSPPTFRKWYTISKRNSAARTSFAQRVFLRYYWLSIVHSHLALVWGLLFPLTNLLHCLENRGTWCRDPRWSWLPHSKWFDEICGIRSRCTPEHRCRRRRGCPRRICRWRSQEEERAQRT